MNSIVMDHATRGLAADTDSARIRVRNLRKSFRRHGSGGEVIPVNDITIDVSYFMPADPNTICTMIYGWATYAVALENLSPGQTYTLVVNDTKTSFTTQG